MCAAHIAQLKYIIIFGKQRTCSINDNCLVPWGIELTCLLLIVVNNMCFFKKKIYLFIYFWLHQVFVAARRLSLVLASGGYSSLWCAGFSLRWLFLLQSMGSRRAGLSSCGTWGQQLWLMGSRAQASQLWRTGLAAPRHVGSSWTRDRTRVPCIGRQILNHCATREVQQHVL